MSISCTTSSLTTAAVCFTCLSEKELRAVRIYLKCAQINGTAVTCNASSLLALATAAGYLEMSVKQQMAVETYLDCQIASGGGTGGGASHGSGTPIATGQPIVAGALYINDNDNTLWDVSGGVWHQLV